MIGKKINQLATELAPASTDLTIIGNPTTGVSKKITLAQLGAIFSGAVSFYTNYAAFPTPGTTDVIFCAKDTKKLYLWSGSAYVEVFPSQALLDTYQLRSEKGVSNGYASLDSSGKVPISQLPSSIMEYKGTWSAATNTPTLANGTGDTGDVYLCNAAGTVNFGAGPITFAVGDYVVYSGTIWQRSSGAVGTVTSVAASITGDAIGITGSPVTTSGTLAFAFGGNSTQYINGAGNLITFPSIISQAANLVTEVYNKTGATLTKGTIVYINGGQGNLPTITKAIATGDSTSAQTFGIVQSDITNNNNGYVVVAGRISDIDTQAYTEGTQLYLSSTTAGTWTSTKQYAPAHLVYVGIVVRAHPTQGVVEVKIQNGYELDELHNVAAQSPDNNDILQYKTATSLWTKVAGTTSNIAEGSNLYYTDARSRAALSFTAGSGAYNSTTGVITIPTNTNQLTNGAAFITLASLSAGAGISYNNTTGVIASTITQYTDAMARAAISLTTTGTSGAATYNSTTGVLNVPQYAPDLSGYVPTSRTLTINGTAYDLSANRSWSVGTVTSVGLSSATSGVTIGSTPITTSGTITLAIATASGSQQGLLSSTDWTTFNNKQSALTNPVTGTGTTNYLPKFTGTSTIGNSAVTDDGTTVTLVSRALSGTSATFSTTLQTTGLLSRREASGSDGYIAYLTTGVQNTVMGFNNSGSTNAQGVLNNYSYFGNLNSYGLQFTTNGTVAMTITTSGNLGLGVTPSAWGSGYTAFQVLNLSLFGTSGLDLNLTSNVYYDGTNYKYISNGYASMYNQYQGKHYWSTVGTGTAGNAISFTQAMTLNASGNLSIGNTNDTYKLDVSGAGRFSDVLYVSMANASNKFQITSTTGTNAAYQKFSNSGGNYFIGVDNSVGTALFTSGGTAYGFGIVTESAQPLILGTNNTARLTIASTGAATFSSSVTAVGLFSTTSASGTLAAKIRNGITAASGSTGYGLAIESEASAATSYALTVRNLAESTTYFHISTETGKVGNVGIGTTSPTAKLVVAATTNAILRVTGTDNTAFSSSTFWTDQAPLFVINNTSTTANTVAGIKFELGNTNAAAGIGAIQETSNSAAGLVFTTGGAASGNNNPERMRITSGGSVGIGTTSPVYKFVVSNSGALGFEVDPTSGSGGILSLLTYDRTAGAYKPLQINAEDIRLQTGLVSTERMRITSGGTLLVGTTTEGFLGKLQVAGSVAITGQYNTVLPSSSFSYFDGSGQVVSSSSSASALYLDTTWNTTGNPDGIYLNVTNTASGASSKLLNLKVGSVSQFSVSKAGAIQTTAPSSGSAHAWKLGSYAAGGTGTATGVIYIEVNGQIYSIPALLGTP